MSAGANPDLMIGLLTAGSTLAGTVIGWLLNQFSKFGKLKIYSTSWSDSFECQDAIGGFVDSCSFDKSTYYHYKLELDIYNDSGDPKIMRDIEIVFSDCKKELFISKPFDESTRHTTNGGVLSHCYEVGPINIQPKTVANYKLSDGILRINNESFEDLAQTKEIYLRYKNKNGRIKKIKIYEEDYSRYFENHPKE